MVFVPGYKQDIFVSYAHVDDRPFDVTAPDHASGWVTTLVRHLENYLAQEIGRTEAFNIWKDKHNLHGNDTPTAEIAAVLESAAIFIAILSPSYLASTWCRDEADIFARRSTADAPGRVFVVEKQLLDDAAIVPQELSGRRNYPFWYIDSNKQPRTFAKPMLQQQEIEYFRQVEDLARDIHRQLKAMASSPSVSLSGHSAVHAGANSAGGATAVLLAEVTDDLELRRMEVRRYLEQQGVLVLPETSYPLGRGEFEAALDSDLSHSRLFVQLLGPMPGKRPPDVPEGYGWQQLRRAREHGLRVLQWRSPDVDPAAIDLADHRELLELETVHASSLETFKRAIAIALVPPPAPLPVRQTDHRPLVFLNTEPRHRAIAAQIREAIGDRAAWAEPLVEGTAEEVRTDFEQSLLDCDAMVMVYGDNAGWARAQLRAFHKLARRREHPVLAIPVIDAPPEQKPELGFYLPEMKVISSRSGIGADTLAQLSQSLRL
jgi:hypothetical protein